MAPRNALSLAPLSLWVNPARPSPVEEPLHIGRGVHSWPSPDYSQPDGPRVYAAVTSRGMCIAGTPREIAADETEAMLLTDLWRALERADPPVAVRPLLSDDPSPPGVYRAAALLGGRHVFYVWDGSHMIVCRRPRHDENDAEVVDALRRLVPARHVARSRGAEEPFLLRWEGAKRRRSSPVADVADGKAGRGVGI